MSGKINIESTQKIVLGFYLRKNVKKKAQNINRIRSQQKSTQSNKKYANNTTLLIIIIIIGGSTYTAA